MRGRRGLAAAAALLAVTGAAALGIGWWRTRNRGAVQRGLEVAQLSGCFGCHGRGGVTGSRDPGRDIGGVPPLEGEVIASYSETAGELREWVAEGMPRRVREERARFPVEGREPLLEMPAFGSRLSARELDLVVAWLSAVAGFDAPSAGPPAAGRAAADRLGCFGCHGPGGRGDLANPGSFKGYIPAWDGADLPQLARDGVELGEWILDGSPARLREQRVARWFLERQALSMPAYRGRIEPEELDAIVAYIQWLQKRREGAS